jgi:hypothetical protein
MKHGTLVIVLIVSSLCGCSRKAAKPNHTPTLPPDDPRAAQPTANERSGPATDLDSIDSGLGDYVSFPACGIEIRQPAGFEKAGTFDGFEQPETLSSVMAVRLREAFAELRVAFTEGPMAARGWTLLSSKEVKVAGRAGILVHFEQPLGSQVFLKWSLIFGDDQSMTMVTAAFPKEDERELSGRMKAAVLSTRPARVADRGTQAGAQIGAETSLTFALEGSKKLKLTPYASGTLIYTQGGVIPTASPEEPLFVAGTALGRVEIADKRQFAKRRFEQTAETKNLKLKSMDSITIDGLQGYELLADAEDAKSAVPLVVFQVILFDEGSYILMQGLVGTALADEYLPEFKAMAHSLKRK